MIRLPPRKRRTPSPPVSEPTRGQLATRRVVAGRVRATAAQAARYVRVHDVLSKGPK